MNGQFVTGASTIPQPRNCGGNHSDIESQGNGARLIANTAIYANRPIRSTAGDTLGAIAQERDSSSVSITMRSIYTCARSGCK